MWRRTEWGSEIGRNAFLYLILFAWMYQLLAPLGQVGNIPDMTEFYLFVGALLLIDLLIPRIIWKSLLKWLAVFYMLHGFFYSHIPLWQEDWILQGMQQLSSGAGELATRHPMAANEFTRTFLFLLFLWIAASVYRNAVGSRVWLFVLLFVGETVLGTIDTFFPPDSSGYVVRYFLFGFLLMAFSQLPELERISKIPDKLRGWSAGWVAWTLLIPLVAVGTGIAAPKFPPDWPDPVSFLQGKAAGETATGNKRIGYGSNDERLGGGFVMDDTVVFSVIANERGYYRGESKTIYTGKGWESTGRGGMQLRGNGSQILQNPAVQDRYGVANGVKSKQVTQEVHIENSGFDVLFAQYQLTDIGVGTRPPNAGRVFDPAGWKVSDTLRNGDAYRVVSQVPYYDPQGIIEREKKQPQAKGDEQYLQLPETLPKRVIDLARQITAGKATAYEKAKAIEQYLRTNYRYQTEDIPYPAAEQDFVDQFLFESKEGYCDHFSTSMVVMARAAGLQARWTKGFTDGEMDLSVNLPDKEMTKYVIRNKNAHSWPEVFIPGTGWIPFEPTATFSQPVIQELAPVPATSTPEPTKNDQPNLPEEEDPSVDVSRQIDWSVITKIALGLTVLLLIAGILFWRKLLVAYYIRRPMMPGNDAKSAVLLAVERLLTALQRFGWKREPSLTVREFGAEITNKGFRGNEWIMVAKLYERVRYGDKSMEQKDLKEMRSLWERILRKAGRSSGRTNKR